jgi:RNA polymerase sigma-B factor
MSATSAQDDELALFREFAATRQRSVRNRLVERHMGLAAHIANRYRRANMSDDDLRQVAMVGLVKAVDRFDPDYGGSFSSFAGPTIEGEIKRHFRDRSWVVRVPRSAKELHLQVRRASDELSHEIGRSPSVEEIARHLDIDRDDVLRGVAAGAAYNVGTIDAASADDGSDAGMDRQSMLATVEHGFEDTENREVILELLDRLPEREQEIVRLRFYERLSQSEIADIVGISQMHVSRLLRRSFDQMREWLDEDHEASSAAARE